MTAPMLVPPTTSISMPRSCSARQTPRCANPRAPPPARTSPTALRLSIRASRAMSRSSPGRMCTCPVTGRRASQARVPRGHRVSGRMQQDAGSRPLRCASGAAARQVVLDLDERRRLRRVGQQQHLVAVADAAPRPRRPGRHRPAAARSRVAASRPSSASEMRWSRLGVVARGEARLAERGDPSPRASTTTTRPILCQLGGQPRRKVAGRSTPAMIGSRPTVTGAAHRVALVLGLQALDHLAGERQRDLRMR